MGHLILASGIIGLLIYLLRTDYEGLGYEADDDDDAEEMELVEPSPMDRPLGGWPIDSWRETDYQIIYGDDDGP
ncbi:hypothetical protein B1C78_00290 [Thioalkalivibrio denitrificans]|uniref:Uncharacterized protein n=1 Tax=Thioalkalivibrio denitrificans TaxID=108003 RepID=A0A1V3NVC4_9GAMM|nr:hypothetical protein B1C78_00290 [Thioalkalivibrio denitrificans]